MKHAAQRENARRRDGRCFQQQLEDRRVSYDLNTLGVCVQPKGLANGGGLVGAGCGSKSLAPIPETIFSKRPQARSTSWRIAREVPLQNLEDASRVLEVGSDSICLRPCASRRGLLAWPPARFRVSRFRARSYSLSGDPLVSQLSGSYFFLLRNPTRGRTHRDLRCRAKSSRTDMCRQQFV